MSAVLAPRIADKLFNVVEVAHGFDHQSADLIDWSSRMVSRDDAARLLREARAKRWSIQISVRGYGIYAGANPAWRYAA